MTKREKSKLSEEQQEFLARCRRELALRPEISDAEFMAETEVSDEDYERGLGAILPAGGEPISMKDLAEEGYMDDMSPDNATILFSMWHDKGITPETLEKGYEDMKSHYIKWLNERGYL